MLDEQIFRMQKSNERLLVLLFLYRRYMKMNRPTTDSEMAVYGIDFNALFSILFFFLKNI